MPSDIRSFFGGRGGGPAPGSSQEQNIPKETVGDFIPLSLQTFYIVKASSTFIVKSSAQTLPKVSLSSFSPRPPDLQFSL